MSNTLWLAVIVAAIAVGVVLLRPKREPALEPQQPSGSPSADAAAAGAKLRALLAPGKRVCFDPVVEAQDTDEPASKFGGLPWSPTGSPWPVCPGCKKPMHFFTQLAVESLPKEAGVMGKGLIQLFMCTEPDSKSDICMETYQHGASSVVVRLIDSAQSGTNAKAPSKDVTWPPRRIVGWTPTEDYPDYNDLDLVGVEADDAFLELYEVAESEEQAPTTHGGDKLGGWPYWVQNAEYGSCRECGKRMHFVLQIDSEDNIPFMFGDMGAGHISQCPDHPHVLVWGWACH